MTDVSLKDQELIDRYLAGRLTDSEELMVETRIVEDPVFRNEVELSAALKEGLHELDRHGQLSALLVVPSAWWKKPGAALAAASAVLAIGISIVMYAQRSNNASPSVVAESLRFEHTRAGQPQADVVWIRPAKPAPLEMRFDVGIDPADRYQVTLRRLDGNARIEFDEVVATTPEGDVITSIEGARFETGDYEVRLRPVDAADTIPIVTYTLSVRAE